MQTFSFSFTFLDNHLESSGIHAILLGPPFFMKRKSPPFRFVCSAAVMLLSLTFLSSSFAMLPVRPGLTDTKKFSIWDVNKDKQDSDIEAQRRMRDQSGDDSDSDNSSLEQRGNGSASIQEKGSVTLAESDFVENLLKQSDPEVLAQLRDSAVRARVLEQVKKYQEEETKIKFSLVETPYDENVFQLYNGLWMILIEDMGVIHQEQGDQDEKTYASFLEDIKLAKRWHSLLDQERALATELMLGVSPETSAAFEEGFKKANKEWKEAFPEYVYRARRMAVEDCMHAQFLKDYYPLVTESEPEIGNEREEAQLRLEQAQNLIEKARNEREEAQLRLEQAQNLIEKARNSSNTALTQKELEEKNNELDCQNAEIDQLIDGVRQTQARSKEFEAHQQFLASLREDLGKFNQSSDFKLVFDRLKGSMALSLHQEHYSVTRDEFMNSPAELSAGVSKWRTQQRDYEAYKQKVDEVYAAHVRNDDMLMEAKKREADCLVALSQLRFDTTPVLDSMREKLMEAYQKIGSLTSWLSPTTPQYSSPEKKEIYEGCLKLADEAVQALGEGRIQAVEAIVSLIRQHQDFFTQTGHGPKPLLLRAEAAALRMKMKTEAGMKQIGDEEMASFPWDFKRPYTVNLNVLQNIEVHGIAAGTEGGHALKQFNIDGAKREKLQALRSRLASEAATPLSSIRPSSQFEGTFLTGGARASELEKLKGPTYRAAIVLEADKWLEKFREILSVDRKDRKYDILRGQRNNSKDPLVKLLENQIQKIKAASAQSDDAFLKTIEETKLLYPYVAKKIELCRQFMRIGPTEWPYQYSDRLEPFWSTMSEATRKVFMQLDQLAASRLLAEQTIIQKNDPYLTHSLDGIRSEDEGKFQRDLDALIATEPRVERVLQQTQSFCSRMAGPALFTACGLWACWAIWALYLYNTSSF